jgi:hypothetical protein
MADERDQAQPAAAASGNSGGAFLFQGVALGGPLEELHATLEKKVLRCQSLGELETAERYRKGYDLARAKLDAVLAAAKPAGGS